MRSRTLWIRDGQPAEDPEAHWPEEPGPWRLHVGGPAPAGQWLRTEVTAGFARAVRPDGLTSSVRLIRGPGVHEGEHGNPFGANSAVPWAHTSGPVRAGDVSAVAVVLTGTTVASPPPAVEVGDGAVVTARWATGETDLAALP